MYSDPQTTIDLLHVTECVCARLRASVVCGLVGYVQVLYVYVCLRVCVWWCVRVLV